MQPLGPALPLSLFDRVRVRATEETRARNVAGLVGQIYGETRPSAGVVTDVIGRSGTDHAFNVQFDDRAETLWFSPELLELVDHAPGTTFRSGNQTWVRDPSGGWTATGEAAADRARERTFQTAFTTLLYGLRDADQWELAARLKAMLGDGAFSDENVGALAKAFGAWHQDATVLAPALPEAVVAAMQEVAAYLKSRG